MKHWLRRIPRPKLLLALATLFALYLVLGGYFLPRYIERAIPEYAAEQLKRKASVRSVSFNPLLFKLELNDVVLMEADERLIARFRRLLVDFELSSLARWAWTFQTIALDGLEVMIDIAPDESVNLAALADSLPKGEPQPDAAPPRLVLQHIDITDAALTFSDRSGERPRFESVRALALELRDISTLPDRRGPYSIAARLPAGATLSWRGEVSLQPIFSAGEVELKAAKPATVWRFLQDELEIAEPQGEVDVALRYRTAYAKGAFELSVEELRVAARDLALSLRGAKQPFFALKAASAAGGRFDLGQRELRVPDIELRGSTVRAQIDQAGKLDLERLAGSSNKQAAAPGAPWRVKLDSVRLADIAFQLRDESRVAPLALGVGAMEADFSVSVQTGAAPQLTVGDIGVRLSNITAGNADAPEPLIALSRVVLEGGNVDLAGQRFAARRLRVDGGSVRLAREADGRLPMLELFTAKNAAPEKSVGKPWGLALDAFELDALKIALADQGFTPPVAYDIDPLTIAVKNIRNEGRAPIRMEAALRLAQGGTLRVSGETVPAGNRASVKATLERLSLKPLQPLVAARTTLTLGSGDVSASVQAQYRALKDRAEVRASGTASLDDLLLAEASSGEPLLAWKSVAATGISFSLAPDKLGIADIAVRGLGAKIVVSKERKLNLAEAIKPAPAAAKAEPAAEPFALAIERVRLDKAAVDFSDLSLVLPFAAKIQDFEGDVLGLSTDQASRAVTKMEGRVDEFGLARVEGSLATYDPKAFLDLRVTFRNVEMVPLSPYTATFAGRRIEAGRLGLDLQYKIDKGALAGDNRVELDKFTLGERVEAPGALNLPLDLAVALLTDSEGRIALAVPVKGNVNEPEFSYGHVIWQAITTVLTNIVTAPFRALFGGGGDAVESIAFDAGRAALTPPEREKLKRVAEALARRPQLKLLIEGQYGDADRAALRRNEVALALAARLEREVEGGEPQPVNARDARTQRALEELFVERASDEAFSAFAAETAKARGKPVERVGRLAALTGNASEDGEFYDALLQRLVDTAPLPADALDKLGAARAGAVEQHLVKALAVPAARVERKPASSADGVRAKLALDVAGSTKM